MARRPSFQFFPGDWLNDVVLRGVSIGARGLWIDLICLMHQGSPYGHLAKDGKAIPKVNLSRTLGLTLLEMEGYLAELREVGVFDEIDGMIVSRRMVRDEEVRVKRAAGGIKGGNPVLRKVNLVPNLRVNLTPEEEEEILKKKKVNDTPQTGARANGAKFDAATYPLPAEIDCPRLRELWVLWCEERSKRRKPHTESSCKLAIGKLVKFGREGAVDALEDAVLSGWTGVFSPKSQSRSSFTPPRRADDGF